MEFVKDPNMDGAGFITCPVCVCVCVCACMCMMRTYVVSVYKAITYPFEIESCP